MIWTLDLIDGQFISAFVNAGDPDQRVIDEYLSRQPHRRLQPPERPGIKRWHYLLQDNPRIGLTTLAMPLDVWQGGTFFLVGTRNIIGEFTGNREFVGMKGLHLKMQPLAWMAGRADQQFASGAQLLAEISEQILDLDAAQRSQRKTRQRYEWK